MNEIITDADFRRRMKMSAPAPGYLFFGDEDYLKQNAVSVAKKSLIPDEGAAAFDYISIDRSSFSAQTLAESLAPPPMLSDHKLIVASVTFDDLRASELNEVYEVLEGLPEKGKDADNILIINVPAGGIDPGYPKRPSAQLKKLAEYLVPVRFDRITPGRLCAWAERHYANNGVTADADVCAATVEYCGTDMFRLSSEIDKISFFALAGGRKNVTVRDIRIAGCAAEEYDAFALANAMMTRKYTAALEVLSQMKAQKLDPTRIMGELIRVICDMNTVSILLNAGMMQNDIATATGIKPFPLGKYMNALRGIDDADLRRALNACVAADMGIKGYSQDYVPIEKLICSL
ncbi:MAG: DNA polymerase III subunit delta [Clostridia bacterium]|nr:DNA polymerase III subunit delta [Clostridia bacterium]